MVGDQARDRLALEQRGVAEHDDHGPARGTGLRLQRLDGDPHRVAVPSWVSCTAITASGTCSRMCGVTCSRWLPTTATRCSGSRAREAAMTWPIMLRPQIRCSTFISFDFIRVPLPAARRTTAAGPRRGSRERLRSPGRSPCKLLVVARSSASSASSAGRRTGSPGRSRTYVALSAFKVRRALPTDQPGMAGPHLTQSGHPPPSAAGRTLATYGPVGYVGVGQANRAVTSTLRGTTR